MNTDHITQYAKRARHLSVVPFITPPQDTRGQTLAAERAWGEFPIVYLGNESEDVKPVASDREEAADVPPHRELMRELARLWVAVPLGFCIGIGLGLSRLIY